MVLVHGYLGSAHSWQQRGIVNALAEHGYPLSAHYRYAPDGLRVQRYPTDQGRALILLDLPSKAPVHIQASWLNHYLQDIRQHYPDTGITLVGHSAGGIVARFTLVHYDAGQIARLITIATPHHGTSRALQALDATGGGGIFGFLKNWAVRRHTGDHLYNTLRRSRGLFYDLSPPRAGNLLYWLNQQPHPQLQYISIIRTGTQAQPGDRVVPPRSQDMRTVPALKDKASSYQMAENHFLTLTDAQLLVNLLSSNSIAKDIDPVHNLQTH